MSSSVASAGNVAAAANGNGAGAGSVYWDQDRELRSTRTRAKPPSYDGEDPVAWSRSMLQHLRLAGLGASVTAAPQFGGETLRTRPGDKDGKSWDEINSMQLGAVD